MVLVGCRFHFDPLGAPLDGSSNDASDGSTTMSDGSPDAKVTQLVQGVSVDTTSGAPITINTSNGLATVTPGNMVMVVCGGLNGPACVVTSTPATTWQQVDPGTTLGVYVACDVPAITSISATNGATDMNLVVTEWSGIQSSASCFDTKRISTACPTAPAAWDTGLTPSVSQNRELLVAVGHAGAQNAGWTIDAPYQIAFDAKGVNAGVNVMLGSQRVVATPTTYRATGTVNQWAAACFTDVFTFRAL